MRVNGNFLTFCSPHEAAVYWLNSICTRNFQDFFTTRILNLSKVYNLMHQIYQYNESSLAFLSVFLRQSLQGKLVVLSNECAFVTKKKNIYIHVYQLLLVILLSLLSLFWIQAILALERSPPQKFTPRGTLYFLQKVYLLLSLPSNVTIMPR